MSTLHDGAILKKVYSLIVREMDLSPGRISTFIEEHIRRSRPPSTSKASINVDAGNMAKALKQTTLTWRTLILFIRSLPATKITIRIVLNFDDPTRDLDIPINIPVHTIKKYTITAEEPSND